MPDIVACIPVSMLRMPQVSQQPHDHFFSSGIYRNVRLLQREQSVNRGLGQCPTDRTKPLGPIGVQDNMKQAAISRSIAVASSC